MPLGQGPPPHDCIPHQAKASTSSPPPYGFTGEWTDPTGLVFLRARYYAPEVGRFFQQDPFRGGAFAPTSLHPYLYAANNPILYTDPSGRCIGELDFLRELEPVVCQRVDMALYIIRSPHASAREKAMAWSYISAWSLGHAAAGAGAILGTIVAPEFALGGAGLGGAYSWAKQRIAASGACGCEAQQAALATDASSAFAKGAIQGWVGGAALGPFAKISAIGRVFVGFLGVGGSAYGAGSSGWNMLTQGVNGCNALDMAISGVGLFFSWRYARANWTDAQYEFSQIQSILSMDRVPYGWPVDVPGGSSMHGSATSPMELPKITPRAALPPPTGVNPRRGPIITIVTQSELTAYRIWGGRSGRLGSFLSLFRPASRAEAYRLLALPPGNTAQMVSRVVVPPGTRIQISFVAEAFGHPGGAIQIELLSRIPASSFGPGEPLPFGLLPKPP